MTIKVFIQGSCVTRDAFEFHKDNFNLVHYGARSSLATLAFENPKYEFNLNTIKSNFQKRMVDDDIKRNVLRSIENKNFDFFIMDFIDERGGLININDYGWVTNSSEFKSTGYGELENIKIDNIVCGSDRHIENFLQGFDIVYNKLKLEGKERKLIINKVFWSTHKDDGTFVSPTIGYINEANVFLRCVYTAIKYKYPEVNFIEYDEKLFLAKKDHKWGLSAFHYIDELYLATIHKINDIFLDEINIAEIGLYKEENHLIFKATVDYKSNDILFAAYLFKDNKKIEQILYQEKALFKFNYFGKGDYKVRFFCKVKSTNIPKIIFSENFVL